MAVKTLEAAETLGAYRLYYSSGYSQWSNRYLETTSGRVGWEYGVGSGGSTIASYSYRSSVAFASAGILTEPAAADQSTGVVHIQLEKAVSDALKVGVLSSALASGPQARYEQLGENQDIAGTIAAGNSSAEFNLTAAQLRAAIAYGIKVFPSVEFRNANSNTLIVAGDAGSVLTCTLLNPASRGRIENITPGNYSSIVGTQAVTVRYTYRHDYGGYAQAFLSVIAANQDTGEVVTILRKQAVSVADGAQGSFTIPADTLEAGRWTLTICAAPAASANYYADSSDFWTNGQEFVFNVRENPSSGEVTGDGKPIPGIEWDSTAQAAFQVRFGEYDSGARVGGTAAFTVPKIFQDGSYPVRVRVASTAGDWSDWTDEEYVTVQNVEPAGDFSAQAEQEGGNIVITWTGFLSADHYAVFRDGKMIAVLGAEALQYVDRYGAGGVYEVYAVTSARYYKPSGPIAVRLNLVSDLISADGGYTWIACRFTPDRKSEPEEIRTETSFVYYAGREKPMAYSSGEKSRTKTFSYIVRRTEREKAHMLRDLEGKTVIVKNTLGESISGIIVGLSFGDEKRPTISFSVRETDGEEDHVEYPA